MNNNFLVSEPATTGLSAYVIVVGIVLLAALVAVVIQYYTWSASPWYADRALAAFNVWDWLPGYTKPPVTPAAPATVPTATRDRANWCFVGEDLTGRWCVRVPDERACDADRLFASRADCELVQGNALPAGIVQNNGVNMLSLAAAHTK
jgi:hypothetical protein